LDSFRPAPPAPQDEELLQGQETNWNQIEEEIEALRERIDRMGPVNVEAITEYAELEERQRFLQHQEEDLISARDRLHEAIRRINVTTRELFSDTFSQIQKNFTEMFQELFGGGKASLSLDDDSDPLESGIEIVAKPPGKQLQSISLLSGGERTMTAVALLFSIYMVKPSPFCFLDEMDAPLDESNINRFIRILQRFVQQSQFCVITHNKRTISAADVIYGVTMQEQGVSRVVSVKLNRKEEDPLFENDDDDVTIADSVRSGKVMPS
jgi:chromosome segregation protein